jgi:hypothetical protein
VAALQDEAARVTAALRSRGLRALAVDDTLYPLFVRVYTARATSRALCARALELRRRARLERWKRRGALLGASMAEP